MFRVILGATLSVGVWASCLSAAPMQSFASPPEPAAVELLLQRTKPDVLNAACCKTCRKGKACGDSCISRDKSCRKGAGCACDG